MKKFEPDYRNIISAAWNIKPERLPQYEHQIDTGVMEQVLGRRFAHLRHGSALADRRAYARSYAEGMRDLGYDVVVFERWFTDLINQGKSLKGYEPGPIQNKADFAGFPWEKLHDRFFALFDEDFALLAETMPEGMKAVGGVGCGLRRV